MLHVLFVLVPSVEVIAGGSFLSSDIAGGKLGRRKIRVMLCVITSYPSKIPVSSFHELTL
jgi:hypothetical protein